MQEIRCIFTRIEEELSLNCFDVLEEWAKVVKQDDEMISSIEIYRDKRADGHLIKTIHFTFPVTYDGESGALFVRTNEQHVETVCLLVLRNPVTHIPIDADAEKPVQDKKRCKSICPFFSR